MLIRLICLFPYCSPKIVSNILVLEYNTALCLARLENKMKYFNPHSINISFLAPTYPLGPNERNTKGNQIKKRNISVKTFKMSKTIMQVNLNIYLNIYLNIFVTKLINLNNQYLAGSRALCKMFRKRNFSHWALEQHQY